MNDQSDTLVRLDKETGKSTTLRGDQVSQTISMLAAYHGISEIEVTTTLRRGEQMESLANYYHWGSLVAQA